jgi:hypothetical protein
MHLYIDRLPSRVTDMVLLPGDGVIGKYDHHPHFLQILPHGSSYISEFILKAIRLLQLEKRAAS